MTYHTGTTKQGGRRFRFLSDTIAELKKVVWLSRREVAYLTFLVLIVVVVVGLVLGSIDLGFDRLIRAIIGG
jgi:preprotein translocase subunit SecE